MRRTGIATCVLVGALTLAACGQPSDPDPPARGPALSGDFSGTGPGALVSAEGILNLDLALKSKTSLAARIVYESTSGINDSHSLVTGTVFVPRGDPPPGGWRIVAFAHPETGIQAPCAPSASPTLLGSADTIGQLLDQGYLVTATDYQGLGLRDTDHSSTDSSIGPYNDYHPFLDSSTEGYNVIDSVRAARSLVPTASDSFAVWGSGQGGQAGWAADELSADYRGKLNMVGVVAAAPTAALDWMADAAADGTLSLDQQLTLQQFIAALAAEYVEFSPDEFRHGVVKDEWDVLSSCWGADLQQKAAVVGQIGPGDLRPESADATEVLRGYLQKTSLPQAPAAAPMLIVPDKPDGLIPQAQTDAAVARGCAMGDVIASTASQSAGDLGTVLGWIADRFNGVVPQDNCPGPAKSGF